MAHVEVRQQRSEVGSFLPAYFFNEVSLAISAPLLFCLPAPPWITYAQHNIQLLMWAVQNKLMVLGL